MNTELAEECAKKRWGSDGFASIGRFFHEVGVVTSDHGREHVLGNGLTYEEAFSNASLRGW